MHVNIHERSVLAVSRLSPTAENIPFGGTNTFKQVEPVTRREKKDLCTSLAFWQLCKQFIFTNYVVKCVCKWSKFLFVVRFMGFGLKMNTGISEVLFESITVKNEIRFLFCAAKRGRGLFISMVLYMIKLFPQTAL